MTRLSDRLDDLRRAGRLRDFGHPGIGTLALAGAEADPDRLVTSEGGRDLTRGELVDLALRLGGALRTRGLTRGAPIAFQLPNWWEACVVNLTAALFGHPIVPLLPIYRAAELGVILPACGVEAIFLPPATEKVDYAAMVASLPQVPRLVIPVRDGGTFADMLAHAPAAPDLPAATDAKMIIFTSGSTGRPKGVIHTHASIDAAVRRAAECWGFGAGDALYVPSPIGHVGGSIYAFEFPWIAGCRVVLDDQWDAARAVRRIDAEGITFMAGATPFLRGLVDAAQRAGTRLPGLRRFICGGASVPPDLVKKAHETFANAVVSRAYGSTEIPTCCPGIQTRAEAERLPDTDGEITVDLRILNADGGAADPGAAGEIAIRAPQMFAGYLDPKDEDGCFTPDGRFLMGDLGRVVEGRFIVITGRTKDIIIRKGENISPLEVENILLRHPAVAGIAIVGAPDPERGEMAVAFVVPRPGMDFDFAAMTAHLMEAGLARQKFPERLEIVDSLPMNTVGKVQKPELRRIAAALVGGCHG